MPNSARYTPSPADLDAIREAQRLIGNEELAERAYTSVSSIQRTLRGDGGYDAVRALLVRVAREVVAEEAAKKTKAHKVPSAQPPSSEPQPATV